MDIDSDTMEDNDNLEFDESDNEERDLELQVIDLENKIAENKFAYQPYIDLIKVLKTLADLDRLRFARQRMAKQFPLSPDLWMDWLQDEVNLATTYEEKIKVIELFKAAVKDYLSVDIWLQYLSFIVSFKNDHNSSDEGIVRKVFEEALTAGGLHVTKGYLLWNAYIDYEKNVLSILMSKGEEFEKQLKFVANLYQRQLSCPLMGMEETYENFQKWLTDATLECKSGIIDCKVVENLYKKAKTKLEKINGFENGLISGSDNLMETYKQYLDHEKSKEGSPVRVQCLYERILCDNCLNEEFWLEYIEYQKTVLNNPDVVLNTCKRALKNCPWCCRIYQNYILCLEKYNQSQSIINGVVEEAFASGLQTATDFRDIWMTYLEYLRRRFDSPNISKEEEEKSLEELRTAFAKAVEYLCQLQDSDLENTVAQFWARIEANYCRNMEKSRELWNTILSDERNKTAEMWTEYIHLERTFGDSKHLRKLFPRALQGTKDWPEVIAKAWLNYERDEGSLESYENCLNKIKVRIKQIQEIREKNTVSEEFKKPTSLNKNRNKKNKKSGLGEDNENKNIMSESDVVEPRKITGYKRKNSEMEYESSYTKKSKRNEEEGEFEKSQQSNDQLVAKLLEEEKTSHGVTVVHDSSKDNRTVFVSNLDFSTEEPTIREVFSSCGFITDLRLVRDYKGRSKGYCYVEFKKPEEARVALKKDRESIGGRPMFVSKCDPDKETRGSGFKYSSNMEKNKLFIRGLPFKTTTEELKKMFSKFGALKDVRLVTYRNGHSKGLAYVEFDDEASAAQAILQTDGTKIDGKEISVAISNPPSRKNDASYGFDSLPSLGGGSKESGSRGRGRTQISFLPRSVQLSKANAAAESLENLSITSPLATDEQKKLSNDDFRQLLK